MAWARPQFNRTQVDKAGERMLESPPHYDEDDEDEISQLAYYDWWIRQQESLEVVNNWRSSHSFPLNTFAMGLRRRGKNINRHILVAQRIKRLSSITAKLERFPTMKLSQMQDIGGCRGIVTNVGEVKRLVDAFKKSKMKHALYDIDDYIERPQRSGYRGIHLKYRYFSDKQTTYNGLRIEVQIRSQLEHAWATAVETVGTFIKQALKSSQGEENWLRFFALMGSAIAVRERSPLVPHTPSGRELTREIKHYVEALNVQSRLGTYGEAIQTISAGEKNAHYYLLKLEPAVNRVTVTGFRSNELQRAQMEYLSIEKAIQGGRGLSDAVLVSVDSIESLKRAYPNYFLDTRLFIDAVNRALKV